MACYYFGSFLENVVSQLLKLEIRSKNVSLWSGIQVCLGFSYFARKKPGLTGEQIDELSFFT